MRECITAHSHIQVCRGSNFCSNAIIDEDLIIRQMHLSAKSVEYCRYPNGIIDETVPKHRFFSVSVSFCPNACSRPQIADFGVIAATIVNKTKSPCSNCNACVEACRESAIDMSSGTPEIDDKKCLHCGSCASVCPSGTLQSSDRGFRVFIGGRMGRHPRFASELPGIYNTAGVVELFQICFSIYNEHFNTGLRFGEMILRYPESILHEFRENLTTAVSDRAGDNETVSEKIISNIF